MDINLQDRILAATNGTKTGAILRCALDRNGAVPVGPAFTGKACCTSDGYLTCNFIGADGRHHYGAFVGGKIDLTYNLQQLAKHLKLDAEEQRQLFNAVSAWIATDYSRN
jgi:hypothetical protein